MTRRRPPRLAWLAVLLLSWPAPASAQPPPPVALAVGDPRIEVGRLAPYRVRWRETIANVLNQVVERGTWVDELARERRDGRDVWVRTIVVTATDGSERERYRLIADARTFAPIRSEWSSAGRSYELDYVGTSIAGTRVDAAGAAPRSIRAELPSAAFDYYAGAMELFLALLPREPGRYTFPAALSTSGSLADPAGIDWPLVEIFPPETARGAAGAPVTATRAEAWTSYGFYKVWLIDSPPFVVRTILLIPPGGRITYELLP